MPTPNYIYFQEDGMWIGWIQEFPGYRTQGETRAELDQNLRDIQEKLTSRHIPSARRAGKLTVQ